jgi:hypothetical protein
MEQGVGAYLLPKRLTAIRDRWHAWLRPLWLLMLGLAVICVIGGTAYVIHEQYETKPVFHRVGLSISNVEPEDPVVGPVGEESERLGIVEDSRIVAVNGEALPPRSGVETLAKRLKDAPGHAVTVRIADPEGKARDYRLTRSAVHAQQADDAQPIKRDVQFAIRLASSLLACGILLACASMLFLRRQRDPVAMLLSFGFLLLAATIDPALTAWLSLGYGNEFDAVSTSGWMLILIGLAAFPDGRFIPRWLRWIVPLAIPLGIMLSIDEVDPTLQIAIGVLIPIGLIGMWWLRYRRLEPHGIERQQIKWAAFGFVAGFLLVGIAVAAAVNWGEENSSVANLVIVTAFSLGFALMPLGLMISLIRFRLWEADVVITRSAAYAAVTVLVGVVWATSTDLVKEMVNSTLGQHNATVSASISAILAAGLFAPTQALVLRWTKKRFAKSSAKLQTMTQRLPTWSATASPAELGMRALAAIAESVHPSRAAVLTLTPTGNELLASRGIDDPATVPRANADASDSRFPVRLPLEDDDGPIGTLLLGPRSDGNRYNRDEREAMEMLVEPLAVAIRQAQGRLQREEDSMQRMLGMVEERLKQIESGMGGAGPATA